MKCGLLGRKLAHSYSPQIHSYLGNYSYDIFEKEPNELNLFFESNDFDCINVTIPYNYMFLMAGDGTPYDILFNLVGGNPVLYPAMVIGLFFVYIVVFYSLYYKFSRKPVEVNN